MQSVKIFMRQIGVSNPALGIVSSQEAEDDLEFNYLSNGYEVQSSHYGGAVRDNAGNQVGEKLLFVLVKTEEDLPAAKAKGK